MKILVSNVEVPSARLGSWNNRISVLIENDPEFFDFILSPSNSNLESNLYCQKRKWITYNPLFYRFQLEHWVARDFLTAIRDISKSAESIKIVVMDDLILCEAIAGLKDKLSCFVELIFSYHGHQLLVPESFGHKIDKIFFLTNLGYLESLAVNKVFSPEVFVVGNGVRSDLFYPLESNQKQQLKRGMGFADTDELVVWMANSRPAKGLHIFLKLVEGLAPKFPHLKFLVIGNAGKLPIDNPAVYQIGKIGHDQLPKYLQISDYYFFTSLWKEGFGLSLVEAIKCGLKVITSINGGIEEVIQDYDRVIRVKEPNKVQAWIEAFELLRKKDFEAAKPEKLKDFHNYENWELKFKSAIEA
ncbi:glycosyltransferase family 4 protein [Mongoliibacter sp.]|uniref:glycosyltransferase family 4 protein n=1 Tax=Mongoliibacter sp. TaxID=2022438 RepID=UPI0025E25568|nr:glycosyltransferase family 4 protein [Mongoliibacter sp.]